MSTAPSLRDLATALGGEVAGAQVLAPGPGHSPRDRSLSVRPSATAPGGYLVTSHAGDDWRACRDHVRDRLGLDAWRPGRDGPAPRERRPVTPLAAAAAPEAARTDTSALALRLWRMAEPHGPHLAAYFAGRDLDPPDGGAAVARYLPARGERPAAVACLIRDAATNEPCGVHLTNIDATGTKLGRKVLGRAQGGAVKLDADDTVTGGLFVGEGVETVLAARAMGLRPAWAALSTSGLLGFPVLAGVECLTVLADHDEGGAGERAALALAERWRAAGRGARVILPRVAGADFLDCLAVLAFDATPAFDRGTRP